MAYSAFVGSFNIDTSKTNGQTQAITGVGFVPKIVLFWWSGTTATGDGARGETVQIGFGALSGSASRWAAVTSSVDAAGTSDMGGYHRDDACIAEISPGTTTINGLADWSSFDADGFTLTIDDQFTTALRVSYLALGGSDLTNVYLSSKSIPTSTGNYGTTGVGFLPDALITCNAAINGTNVGALSNRFSVGIATGSSNQGTIFGCAGEGLATTDTDGYGYDGEILVGNANSSGSITIRDAFVQFDSDGFTLNHLEGTQARIFFFVCLKGGQYKVGSLTTRTDGNDIVETEPGFQPVALLFLSANRALSTQDTSTAHNSLSIGAATSATNRAAQAVWDENNLADTETATANYDTAAYANVQDDAIVGLMDIKSIDSTGFTAVMDDADPSENWVTYLAIGATTVSDLSININDSITVAENSVVSIAGEVGDLFINVSDLVFIDDSGPIWDFVNVAESVSLEVESFATVSDSIAVAESITQHGENYAAVADSIALAESVTPEVISFAAVTDSISVAESVTLDIALSISVAETVTLAESTAFEGDMPAAVSDSIAIAESITLDIILSVALSDNITVAENTSVLIAGDVAPLQINVSDTIQVTEARPVQDVIFVTEAVALEVALSAVASDSVTVAEAISVDLAISPSVSDAVGVAESVAFQVDSHVAVTETVTVIDAATLEIGTQIAVSDAVTVAESVAVAIAAAGELTVSVSDSVSVADTPALDLLVALAVEDPIALTEAVNVLIAVAGQVNLAVSDDIAVAESVALTVSDLVINVSDAINVSDVVALHVEAHITVSDGIAIVEALTITALTAAIVADTVTLGEAVSLEVSAPQIAVSDAIGIAENIGVSIPAPGDVLFVTISDGIAIAELLTLIVVTVATPLIRTYAIAGEDRIYSIDREVRTLSVPAEERILTVEVA